MCGIAGLFGASQPELVERMLAQLGHRGPDGRGLQVLPRATLGHTRLSILDLEAGHQPMGLEGNWLSFNGEIYNYRHLQQRHLPGEKLRGHSDTEVLLHLYRKLGWRMLSELDGMFALALADGENGFLARDPLGIKPLYYGEKKGCLYFASEIKALALCECEVKEFPAGAWWHSQLGWGRYYELEDPCEPFTGTEQEARAQMERLLGEAVHKRLLADVPVGISLSGGLDSSIVAVLANDRTRHLHSFVVGMEGGTDLAAARLVAEQLGNRHHERLYSEEEMQAALPTVIRHLESFDPALVRSALPNFFLAELASREVKVILTGEGADELYAGYDYMGRYTAPEDLQQELLRTTRALHNTNLQRADRVPMAWGLEARVPFLDKACVAFAFSLPASWKLHGGRVPKHLLREAFRPRLPAEIVDRPKLKFSKGAGSSEVLRSKADAEVTDTDFARESRRLKQRWDYTLPNKEALAYLRIFRGFFEEEDVFPSLGCSRSL